MRDSLGGYRLVAENFTEAQGREAGRIMTWDELNALDPNGKRESIESRVLAKLGGRLEEFFMDEVGGQLVLGGKAKSHHVKQLAQHEVMHLTSVPIIHNNIKVLHVSQSNMR